MSYRTLTPSALRRAAYDQLCASGTVTTLEVKSRLRAAGFWATQAAVSRGVARLAGQAGWVWVDTGRHRIYAAHADDLPDFVPVHGTVFTLHLN